MAFQSDSCKHLLTSKLGQELRARQRLREDAAAAAAMLLGMQGRPLDLRRCELCKVLNHLGCMGGALGGSACS